MYYYSGAIVKVPGIGNVTVMFIWLHDYKVDILLQTKGSPNEVNHVYIYHVDDDYFEQYEGQYTRRRVLEDEPCSWHGSQVTERRPVSWTNEIVITDLMDKEPVEKAPAKLNSIMESIMTQPQLKAEDIIKELSFLEYDLTYKPIKLSASKGWKAKDVRNDEIVPFDAFIFDVLYLLKKDQ